MAHDRHGGRPRPGSRRAAVLAIWRGNGLRTSTQHVYLAWVRRFAAWCTLTHRDPIACLTATDVDRFARSYAHRRRCAPKSAHAAHAAHAAVRAWALGLAAAGEAVPPWRSIAPRQQVWPVQYPLLQAYAHYRVRHRGVAPSTTRSEAHYLATFLRWLRRRARPIHAIRLVDIDAFLGELAATMTRKTVAGVGSMLRAFLRFLHATGRLPADLSASVVTPIVRRGERPPRALPWADVRRILRHIDRTSRRGRRDYALLLIMAVYGLGSGEVRGLRLDDIDWRAGTLRIVRPKTGAATVLPLLPAVGQALLAYLRHGRPPAATARTVFVAHRAPYGALAASSAVRHVLVKHAHAVGVRDRFLGSHALRHSHACRHIELGTPPKVVSDILGHRRAASTSAYVRIATTRLRAMALPVPA